MTTMKRKTTDPDMLGGLPALRRAAKRARALSKATGTPFYVLRKGKVVDLNAAAVRRPKAKRAGLA